MVWLHRRVTDVIVADISRSCRKPGTTFSQNGQGAIFHPTPVFGKKGQKHENLEKHDFSDFPRFLSKISKSSISSLATSWNISQCFVIALLEWSKTFFNFFFQKKNFMQQKYFCYMKKLFHSMFSMDRGFRWRNPTPHKLKVCGGSPHPPLGEGGWRDTKQ
jgi:hypothetical protein